MLSTWITVFVALIALCYVRALWKATQDIIDDTHLLVMAVGTLAQVLAEPDLEDECEECEPE